MSLTGRRLGPYEVGAPLGAGGMGEVYRARDTKLGRDVALKVLPPEFANDSERLARFQREAQVLAALNHPNIAIIHGLEDADGTPALVLELVEGPTLTDRIADGPIPVDETVRIGRQIAAALEAAHEQGIVHRDLKPSNIKITPAGVVKVLDFGLAKLVEGPTNAGHYVQERGAHGGRSVRPDLTASPTITSPAMMTGAGMILGTAAYMAPEQARGKAVDKRADIWAFGCVLYEMLTGKRPFDGSDVSDTLASVLKLDPAWNALPSNTPPALRRLLRRGLEKDPGQRLHDIADARLELEEALREPEPGVVVAGSSTRRRGIAMFAAIALTAIVSSGIVWWMLQPGAPAIRRFAIVIPADAPLRWPNDPNVTISPDGSRLVYVAGPTQEGPLRLRAFDRLETTPLAGTETGHSPVFSPDGEWVAFFDDSDRALKKVSLVGGPPVTLAAAPAAHLGAAWGSDGMITFAGPVLSRVSAAGGAPAAITTLDSKQGETRHAFPDVLPNNRGVLFTTSVGTVPRIEVLRFDTGERQVIVDGGSVARYAPTGHVVYAQAGRLFAMPFDQDQFRVTGSAVPVLDGVAVTNDGPPVFSFSRDGSLVYLPGSALGAVERALVWVDSKGREEPLPVKPRPYTWARVSPDGTRVALQVDDPGNTDIWIHDLKRNTQTRLTFEPGPDRFPIWTPDGQRVLFVSGSDLMLKSADGTGDTERLATLAVPATPYAWSGDGKTLLFHSGAPQDIYVMPLNGDAKPQPLIHTQFAELRPAISRDGRWIAYHSNESGRNEVYVQPFPEVNRGRWQVSTDGGDSAVWSSDGRRLFYRLGTAMMTVGVKSGQTFTPGTPSVLFEGPPVFSIAARDWDLAPDGQRFLMTREQNARNGGADNIVVVQNWFDELKRLVSTR